MSAWAELVNHDGSDEWLELCNNALVEVQTETARKLAEKIRSQDPVEAALAGQDAWRIAADLIDPEVST
jgi:DNA-binding SARP family transcriptional activator